MLLDGFFQNGYVVDDIERAAATIERRHGVAGFQFLEPELEAETLEGFGRVHVKVALGWVGRLQVELIQPVGGFVRHYRDIVGGDLPIRHHHVGLRVEDWDATLAMIRRAEGRIVYQGSFGGVSFVYVDERETLGHYVEYLHAGPEGWRLLGWPEGA